VVIEQLTGFLLIPLGILLKFGLIVELLFVQGILVLMFLVVVEVVLLAPVAVIWGIRKMGVGVCLIWAKEICNWTREG
jgi:hypothetical protein